MRLAGPLLLALAVGLTGCGGDVEDEPRAATTTSTTERSTTSSSTTTSSPTSTTRPFDGSVDPVTAPSATDRTALLTDVAVTSDGGVDRIELTFADAAGAPGVDVRYVDRVVADGSGEQVDVEGEAFLQIRLEPSASVDLRGEEPIRTYEGPDRVRGDTTSVTEVVRVGDFEGVLTWAAGTRSRAPFRVLQLLDPARVVVEVRGT